MAARSSVAAAWGIRCENQLRSGVVPPDGIGRQFGDPPEKLCPRPLAGHHEGQVHREDGVSGSRAVIASNSARTVSYSQR